MVISKFISSAIESGRRILKVVCYGRSDVRFANEVSPFGDDGNPIPGMQALYADTSANGQATIIGYINTNRLAGSGEKRIYSVDSNGNLQTYIWLHSDGTIDIGGDANHMTQFEGLKTAFDTLKSDFNNLVNTFNSHTHGGVQTGGGISAPTTTPGTATSADINGAKLTNIKTQ